jgi:hypothetical protein
VELADVVFEDEILGYLVLV